MTARIVGIVLASVVTLGAAASPLEERIAAKHAILSSDQWGGGHRIKFDFNGHTAWLIEPENPVPEREWFWTMQWVDAFVTETGRDLLVRCGLYHVHLDVHELRANAEGLIELGRFQDYLVNELRFAPKARLVGMSWGGFYSVRYAARFPNRVDRMYLDAPLMNVYTRPEADLGPWLALKPAINPGADDPEQPINMAAVIAESKVPVFLVYGGADVDVKPKDNCEIFVSRYQAAGGTFAAVDVDPVRGHHPHGPSKAYFDKLIDFMTAKVRKAEVSIDGDVVPGTNLTMAAVRLAAQIYDVRYASSNLTVEVSMEPVGGGERSATTFEIAGCGPHSLTPSFADLTPGRRYRVAARLVIDGETSSAAQDAVVASREFTWFDESAATFPNAGWSYDADAVGAADGLIVGPPTESQTVSFVPPKEDAAGRNRILLQLVLDWATDFERLEPIDGSAGVTGVLAADGVPRLAVWGENAWHLTDFAFTEGEERTVEITMDRPERMIGYRFRQPDGTWVEAGAYRATDPVAVTSISVEGLIGIRHLSGAHYDQNLVVDASGVEYPDFASAKVAGAEEPLEPLWLSTWPLPGEYGTMRYRDPFGLMSFTGASRILDSERTGGDGELVRCWYGPATEDEIKAGAIRYVRQTVALGLGKAITEDSDIRLRDWALNDGGFSFGVDIDGTRVDRSAVASFVEVCDDLRLSAWRKPSGVKFADGKVTVAAKPETTMGFSRVRIE